MTVVAYLPGEAEGAYPNGTRIVKVAKEAQDFTKIGTTGEVIASHYIGHTPPPEGVTRPVTYFYFVVWDDVPLTPVGVSDWKIGKENE